MEGTPPTLVHAASIYSPLCTLLLYETIKHHGTPKHETFPLPPIHKHNDKKIKCTKKKKGNSPHTAQTNKRMVGDR